MDFRQHLSDSLNEIAEYIQEGGNRGGDSENTEDWRFFTRQR